MISARERNRLATLMATAYVAGGDGENYAAWLMESASPSIGDNVIRRMKFVLERLQKGPEGRALILEFIRDYQPEPKKARR